LSEPCVTPFRIKTYSCTDLYRQYNSGGQILGTVKRPVRAGGYILRLLERNWGRGMLTILAVTVGVAFLVVFASLNSGIQDHLENRAVAENDPKVAQHYEDLGEIVSKWVMVLLAVASLLVMLSVGNAILISLSQRKKELAILRAVGISRGQIVQLVVAEAAVLSLYGFILGASLGACLSVLFDWMFTNGIGTSALVGPSLVTPGVVLMAALVSVGMGSLVSLPLAVSASRVEPVEIFRGEV